MGFLSNIKVAQKLALIGVLAFIATVIVGLLGYVYLKEGQEDLENLYRDNTMSLYQLGEVRYNVRFSQIQCSLQPYTVQPDQRKDRLEKFNKASPVECTIYNVFFSFLKDALQREACQFLYAPRDSRASHPKAGLSQC